MSTQYFPRSIYGIYLDEDDIREFLSKHGFEIDDDEWDQWGYAAISVIPGLGGFNVFSADAGGYTNYFGIECEDPAAGKIQFEKHFPNVKDAEFQQIVEIL